MHVAVEFENERIDVEVGDDQLIGAWQGPRPLPADQLRDQARRDLEAPVDFPPLRQAVVPGDRVVLPIDPDVPDLGSIVGVVAQILAEAGIEPASIQTLSLRPLPQPRPNDWPSGVEHIEHDPDDQSALAYLASTEAGRRIYLNKTLTDADVVVPIGLLGFDPVLGYRGPWSTIFPDLSDSETKAQFQGQRALAEPSDRGQRGAALTESAEVSRLLGTLYHVGVLPGASGAAGIIAGHEATVRGSAMQALDRAWTFRAEERADLVIAGIGQPDQPTDLDDLTKGLSTAARLVRRGGKIAILSKAGGDVGPALKRLAEVDDPITAGPSALRGLEEADDYPIARQLAKVLAWADVYLLSHWDRSTVDSLAMIALAKPSEAARLAKLSPSCLIVSQAERTRPEVADE